jgi:hypothetical protein
MADIVTEDIGQGEAEDEVRAEFTSKAPLHFGDLVGLAIHDHDNEKGIKATVAGAQTSLVGDGAVLDDVGNVTKEGSATMDAVKAAVALSTADIHAVHAAGQAGTQPFDALMARYDSSTKLFAPETRIPTLSAADLADKDNPEVKWKFGTVDELLGSGPFQEALKVFAKEKKSELSSTSFKGDKKKAINKLGDALVADPVAIMSKVINYTPDTGGGIVGQSTDGNARDYVSKAKKLKAMPSLTSTQRINLLVDLINGWYDGEDDQEAGWAILETAPDPDAREVIKWIGWGDLADFFDGVEDTKFRNRFPADQYR